MLMGLAQADNIMPFVTNVVTMNFECPDQWRLAEFPGNKLVRDLLLKLVPAVGLEELSVKWGGG